MHCLFTRCSMSAVLNLSIDGNSLTVSLTACRVHKNHSEYSSAALNANPFQIKTSIQSVPQELQISTFLSMTYLFSCTSVILLVSESVHFHISKYWGNPICYFGLRITVRLWCCCILWNDCELHIHDYLW